MANGSLIIISAPSGAGKSSLVKALLAADPRLGVSTSHTTRPPRPGEQHGVEYYFSDRNEFLAMSQRGEFVEQAEVFGNFYGTSVQELARLRDQGRDVILEIDQQGAAQVRKTFDDAISIFILPPSFHALRERLVSRGQDEEQVIQRRLDEAASEIAHCDEFDYLVVNDQFPLALGDLQAIIQGQRLMRARQLAVLGGSKEGLLSALEQASGLRLPVTAP